MNNRNILQKISLLKHDGIIVRPLNADDYQAYRALRQKILAMGDGRYFSDSYTREDQLTTETAWRNWCSETADHCIMGTFADGILIGIMMITRQGGDKSASVEWEATWLDPHYRKTGVGRIAYEKVYEWTLRHGYKMAIVFVRADNVRSQEIREGQGFVYTHTKTNEVWADGSVAHALCYSLDLTHAKHIPITAAVVQMATSRDKAA